MNKIWSTRIERYGPNGHSERPNVNHNAARKAAKDAGAKTFFTGLPCRYGHIAERRTINGGCAVCDRSATKERCRVNHDKYYENKSRAVLRDRRHYLISSTRSSAKSRGLEHTITADDLSVGENCQCCGVKFEMEKRSRHARWQAPSVDRLDNTKGYIPGNVNIICLHCNWIKGKATTKELRAVADWVESKLSL